MKNLNRVGEKHTTNEGYEVEIIEYFNHKNCTVKLIKSSIIICNLQYGDIKRGEVKNYYHPSVFNTGYLGIGRYNTKNNKKQYRTWKNMMTRCYDNNYQNRQPTYKGCTVDERWHNFQNFATWHEKNYKDNFVLDKDILVKRNKIYSPETCCFVPQEINNLINKRGKLRGEYPIGVSFYKKYKKFITVVSHTNKTVNLGYYDTPEEAFQVYKKAKELYIKEIANKYKNQITEVCYQALLNYKVNIND